MKLFLFIMLLFIDRSYAKPAYSCEQLFMHPEFRFSPETVALVQNIWSSIQEAHRLEDARRDAEYKETVKIANKAHRKITREIDHARRTIKTATEFSQLSEEARNQIIDYASFDFPQLQTIESSNKSSHGKKINILINNVKKDFEKTTDLSIENDNDMYVQIGALDFSYTVIQIKETQEVIGMKIRARQIGGMHEDNPGVYSYPSVAKAKDAGVDTQADVSWAASAIYDLSGGSIIKLSGDLSMDWTGH